MPHRTDSMNASNMHPQPPLTIKDWCTAEAAGGALERLLDLVRRCEASDPADPAWIAVASPQHIKAQWQQICDRKRSGIRLPLYGVPFAVKDNIDAAGFATTAACPDFAYNPDDDASCVQVLKAAGAILVGKTNLDAFATGLVGTRSPYGAVPNTFDDRYVSGGSSSGSASVVARGLVPFALGTDTAGSGRVPAGLNNIIGLKGTRGALSTRGVLPACRSLDCVTILALTLEDTSTVFEIAAQYDPQDSFSRKRPISTALLLLKKPRIAICENPPWFGGDVQKNAYKDSLDRTQSLPWTLELVDFSSLFKLASLLYEGPWVAERYAAIKDFIEQPNSQMDPVVRGIIERAKGFNAVDVFEGEYLKADLIRDIEVQFADYDAILVPTTPTFPTMEELRSEPVLENSKLGTYTNFVNFMDWTAVSVPAGFRSDGLPFGLTFISTAWQEQKLLALGRHWLSLDDARPVGALQTRILEDFTGYSTATFKDCRTLALAVVGAHISGLPLNFQLTDVDASLRCWSKTSPSYRLYELPYTGTIRKPGLCRVSDEDGGSSIDVQIWDIPIDSFGTFLENVLSPLAIGSVELIDGSWVKGFVCEPCGLANAHDITAFGAWIPYLDSLKRNALSETNALISTNISGAGLLFNAVLVANRGEIAVRIISTLRKLGIKAIAIYSQEDRNSQHVQDADVSYLLDGEGLEDTYLSEKAVIGIAKLSNAEAIIPGYGFLSESASLAELCEAAGLVWIGPTPSQMRDLGLKASARKIAHEQAVPLLPGTGLLDDPELAAAEADRIGYPVIVKSNSGGGGIGLQQCGTRAELQGAVESVSHLGKSYFNDGALFIEKFIQNARHIEVQIIGDGKGRVCHAGDRDCSLQRRKQKVIEESPAVFVPDTTRKRMRQAALKLTASVQYRGVGTVEFIYDVTSQEFFFLEVNTRLQVEHPITEATFGLDLVEVMLQVAAGQTPPIFDYSPSPKKFAIEARIYGESPLQNFRPSPGQLTEVFFPPCCRVDTWVDSGAYISPMYDPLLAKLIVVGYDRPDAVRALSEALDATVLHGIETNLQYLRNIVKSSQFQSGDYNTTYLGELQLEIPAFEVLEPGPATTIQDVPGRAGLWHVGIPPSGPMDNYSFRLANRLLENAPDAAGLECTSSGPGLLFHADTIVAVVGSSAALTIDGIDVPYERPMFIKRGQTLRLGTLENGARACITIKGGVNVPKIMGSRSTFVLGKIGGYNGRSLRHGDIVHFPELSANISTPLHLDGPLMPLRGSRWILRVVCGPHGSPDYFTRTSLNELLSSSWKVHYNSNRVGVRLNGPRPQWARETGGEAGLHPSNIHDSPYSIGSISFTGDEAVILTCDGPSLGGFVVFAVVVSADMWKVGQMRPGDGAHLLPITLDEAIKLDNMTSEAIENLRPLDDYSAQMTIVDPVVGKFNIGDTKVVCRQAGDRAVLLEFGDDVFSIESSMAIYEIMEINRKSPIHGVSELTPGVRSLHITFDLKVIPPNTLFDRLKQLLDRPRGDEIQTLLPSRIISMPLAIDHATSLAAIERYIRGIRAEAPWLPSNTSFLQRINALPEKSDVDATLFSATYLVLGLGDVFCGSPCAVPLDPRQRLFGMKYNPSRSWTAEGTVGVGGQYICIYAIDSPGGYQLVGRTARIWNQWTKSKDPWFFDLFDQIRFYPIAEQILDDARANGTDHELIKVEEAPFDVQAYKQWLGRHGADIADVQGRKWELLRASDMLAEAMAAPAAPAGALDNAVLDLEAMKLNPAVHLVWSGVSGKCWKCAVEVGDVVEKDQEMFRIEAMKMEVQIRAPARGKCTAVLVEQGVVFDNETPLAVLERME
ncbi:allophanate hydrolase [Melanomma pulvis-pyrius CBS 109.77]|uniref:Allophanate hydrolase n=1 Tax=Melanomma pulvis-pyrius CBS 109.77 TaxID=1314802 RepID=A0A6A6XGM6_9PLEO|nr:allophanate hydrolase [Melanomma pulvis-pyrius CBS 109.77]